MALAPYTDLPETDGLVLESVEEIEETARLAIMRISAQYPRYRDREIEDSDLYERTFDNAEVDGKTLRWRIEQATYRPGGRAGFGELGVIAAFQGIHSASDGPWIPSRLGDERTARTSYPWRDLIDSGALLANGTDVPVEPIDPIASLATVSQRTSQGEMFPEQP